MIISRGLEIWGEDSGRFLFVSAGIERIDEVIRFKRVNENEREY